MVAQSGSKTNFKEGRPQSIGLGVLVAPLGYPTNVQCTYTCDDD